MLSEQIAEIKDRIETTGIGLRDALAVLDMMVVDKQTEAPGFVSPYETFQDLNKLIDQTVHGAKVERFRAKGGRKPFHTLEIQSEEGEILGYLNMVYLRRRIPFYYLVYVEVMPPFRGMGLGQKILRVFMEFAKERKAVGLLDNIIPPEEETYEIYTKLGWKKIGNFIEGGVEPKTGNYMVFVPDSIPTEKFKIELPRILFGLRKKRSVIDMHDNEDMVGRTIGEFRSIYGALVQLFGAEIESGIATPLMRFMFTRLVTKLLGFRRRIASLIGYTGGESLEQISLSDPVKNLPIQPYAIWRVERNHAGTWGDVEILQTLPRELKEEPTFFIEGLPLYERPYLREWKKKSETEELWPLTISHLLTLGFDPTRLREFRLEGIDYIFERLSPHFFSSIVERRRFLRSIEKSLANVRFRGTRVRTNLPLAVFQDRGNVYVLRRKVDGVHSQEALDQLRTASHLREMNRAAGIEATLLNTLDDVKRWLRLRGQGGLRQVTEELTHFVSWDIEKNFPRIHVDDLGVSLETLWIA